MARLSDQEIEQALGDCEGWSRDGEAIVKEFDRGDFAGSVDFVNAIAPSAEEMNHHPDLEISWSKVKVKITTHSEGGLTENDFELARKVDAAA
jgi:4a-hydroxytetrahydrobiopterin dehydratase